MHPLSKSYDYCVKYRILGRSMSTDSMEDEAPVERVMDDNDQELVDAVEEQQEEVLNDDQRQGGTYLDEAIDIPFLEEDGRFSFKTLWAFTGIYSNQCDFYVLSVVPTSKEEDCFFSVISQKL